jgi:hypothetical protein
MWSHSYDFFDLHKVMQSKAAPNLKKATQSRLGFTARLTPANALQE